MSYTKTTWVNNTTPINETNLNKIEQGIYDNSLVVDAVTNTLNPTDTETYKTAELTEGQITDVIGVKDIIIKGQTEQDGTPTPSAPVDVNVVTGSNVINTSGKNKIGLKNGKYISNNITINVDNGIIKFSGTTGSSNSGFFIPLQNDVILKNEETNILSIKTVGTTNSQVATRLTKTESTTSNNSFGRTYVTALSNNTRTLSYTQTERETYKYFYIQINANQTFNFELYSQLEQGSTATTYEPHQGKELPLDLPVENLYNNVSKNKYARNDGVILDGTTNYIGFNDKIAVLPNTTYTVTFYGITPSNVTLAQYNQSGTFISRTSLGTNCTFTTTNNTYYIFVHMYNTNATYIEGSNVQLEKGSIAHAFTPYNENPIELCKIGDYQDYFYKSGSKWYLHKEIGKIILNGTENWIDSISQYGGVSLTGLLSSSPNIALSNILKYQSGSTAWTEDGKFGFNSSGVLWCKISNTINSLNDWKAYLNSNNMIIYYHKYSHTDTEITDTTLIYQLEAIYNAPLYEQTNITQTNNDLPMILDITACKDNINGIKAFIRK